MMLLSSGGCIGTVDDVIILQGDDLRDKLLRATRERKRERGVFIIRKS